MEIPGIPAPLLTALSRSGVGPVALVGGGVRDLLLHRVHNDPWRGLPDLDLVVQGRASELVKELVDALAGQLGEGVVQRCQEHGAYGTVELELNLDGQQVLLDVATARCETYPVPAENPQVSFGSMADDLARRDFSINAMALDLVSGTLLDPHGGQADLELRRLRFLHHGSVRDDPTRLVRGARYAARLGLELDGASADQAAATLAQWPWPWRQGDPPAEAPSALGTRLRMELELLLEREPWLAALGALQRWGALALLDPELQADTQWPRRLRWAVRLGLPLLVALVAGARQPLALAERLQLPHRQHRLLAQWLELRRRLMEQQLEGSPALPEHWCALLEASGCSPEAVALALACGSGPRRPLLRWLLRWRQVKAELTAADLLAAGMRQGPELGQRLRELRAERLRLERI
ncbi:CCA tRNA nucleotidyltransferase [Cyanobium sp. Maggiore-St4-Cus]|nr:CCA tRNA nucleotidyltransferase [Cyanobium sp. Maggiore-St4-Cus]